MTTDWSRGYYVASAYTGGFYPEHMPASMAWASLVAGSAPPAHAGRPFTYLDLGCGYGETAIATATAYPEATVLANDLLPDHIVSIRDRAEALGLTNLRVLDQGFDEVREPIRADFIASHGVLSWITEDVRDELAALIDRAASPGALVYVSYNAMPGRAAATVLRRMVVDRMEHETGTPLQRLEKALAFAARVQESSHFFKGHPHVGRYLEQIRKRPVAYLAHELINTAWDVLWFRDVEALLAKARCTWIGGADSVQSVRSLATPRSMRQMLDAIHDRSERQTVRDVLLNTSFRRDLFGRGRRTMPAGAQRRRVLETRFALAEAREDCKLDVVVPAGEIRLHDDPYEKILDAIAEGPTRGFDLVGRVDDDPEQVFIGLLVLNAVGHLRPCITPEPDPERDAWVRAVNRRAVTLIDEPSVRVVSPLTGLSRKIGRFEGLVLRGILEGVADIPRFAAERLTEAGQQLILDDMPVIDMEEIIPELAKVQKRFDATIRPTLVRDGILPD